MILYFALAGAMRAMRAMLAIATSNTTSYSHKERKQPRKERANVCRAGCVAGARLGPSWLTVA
jgi:hypothetical protein